MTAVQWLIQQLQAPCRGIPSHIIEESLKKEEEQLKKAIMYSLDEDGHTGDWKIKFANDYYENKFGK